MTREEAEATLADIRRGVEQGWHAVRSNPGTWSAALQRAEHALRAFGPMLEALEAQEDLRELHPDVDAFLVNADAAWADDAEATWEKTQAALALARKETT